MVMRSPVRIVIVLLAVVLLAAACGDDDEAVRAGGAGTTSVPDGGGGPTGTYLSVDVTEDGAPRPLVAGTTIHLTLDGSTIGASLGCNSLGGGYTLDGDVLVVDGGLSMTEMGCDPERHAQDEWFADLLASRPTLAVDGDTLTITAGTTVVVLQDREVADPDRALVGTRWEVDGFLEGTGPDGTAMSMVVDEPATLELRDDGLVVGSDGCNGFGYGEEQGGAPAMGLQYEVDGDRITFTGEAPSTLIACPDLADYIQRVRAVLAGTVAWSIEADRLTLLAEDGRGVTYRAVG